MDISFTRIQNDLRIINSFNETPGRGITRFSFSEQDQRCRQHIAGEFAKLSIPTWTDNFGNFRAAWNPGNSAEKPILLGSHSDTVRYGGPYDGLYGVVAALEVFRCLAEHRTPLTRPLEFIIFVEEEGSNFGSTTVGSKALAGILSLDDLKGLTDATGRSYYQYLVDHGLNPDALTQDVLQPGALAHVLELHIEQSFHLAREKKQIGIVENVAGIKTLQVTIIGESNHAGATPMHLRRDPLVAAGIAIQEIERIATESACPDTVATVGRLEVVPNATNIIASQVTFTIDIRDVVQGGIDQTASRIESLLYNLAHQRNLTITTEVIAQGPCVALSPPTINIIKSCAEKRGVAYRLMNSGAVHDCAILGTIVPANLIFVPSQGGKSHCPEEYTSDEDLSMGAQIYLDTVLTLLEV
jgi:hydantoinase/carbamoylase family amidase